MKRELDSEGVEKSAILKCGRLEDKLVKSCLRIICSYLSINVKYTFSSLRNNKKCRKGFVNNDLNLSILYSNKKSQVFLRCVMKYPDKILFFRNRIFNDEEMIMLNEKNRYKIMQI